MSEDIAAAMQRLEERFVAWANRRRDIRAAVVVGSRARLDHAADEWADLDIGFFTTDTRRYLSSDDWLSEIGDVWVTYADPTGVTRHVLYEGGLDAGFAPLPHGQVKMAVRFVPLLRRFPVLFRLIPGGARLRRDIDEGGEYYRRGVRIILDKDGLIEKLLAMFPPESRPNAIPAGAAFTEAVNEFWFAAAWTAKHLRRGELWWAKASGLDGRMKELLLEMTEWHAWVAHGPAYDTWRGGRFLEEWADPRVVAGLQDAFARYDADDAWRALFATMELFRWLATETAERLRFPYPRSADQRVSEWVTGCFSERPRA